MAEATPSQWWKYRILEPSLARKDAMFAFEGALAWPGVGGLHEVPVWGKKKHPVGGGRLVVALRSISRQGGEGMDVSVQIDGTTAILGLQGRFDFNAHRDFRNGYAALLHDDAITELVVDLRNVDYLDSSALGMLLLLRERVSAAHKKLALANCHGMVAQVLEVANFGKMFVIR
jgi:anti-anti-sigma factor